MIELNNVLFGCGCGGQKRKTPVPRPYTPPKKPKK